MREHPAQIWEVTGQRKVGGNVICNVLMQKLMALPLVPRGLR